MVSAVTDPALIQRLEAGAAAAPKATSAPITDPGLIKQLESGANQPQAPQEQTFVDQAKEQGIVPALESVPGRISEWWKSRPGFESGSPEQLEALYKQKTGKTLDTSSRQGVKDFVNFTANDPEAVRVVQSNPFMTGFMPGEGLIRSPIDLAETGIPHPMPAPLAAPERKAIQTVAKGFQSDMRAGGPGPNEAASKLANAGPAPMSLADVGGETVKGIGENVATQPGEGRQIATQFLNQRDAAAGPRLIDQTVNGLSSGKTAFQTTKELQEARAADAKPLYDEAFKANQNIQSPWLDRFLKTPAGRKSLADARTKMQNDMALLGVPDKELTEQARETGQLAFSPRGVATGLKLRTWDYIKRALDDQIGASLNSGERDNARILIGAKNRLVSELDKADVTAKAGPNSMKPEGGAYARARAAWSGPTQSANAVEEGGKVFAKSPEQIAQEMADLSPGDRDFYRIGAADSLRKRIASTSSGGNEALRIVGNDYVKQQFRPLFPNQDAYDRFIKAAENEDTMFRTRAQTLGNSRTAARLAAAASEGGDNGNLIGNMAQAGSAMLFHEPIAGFPALYRAAKQLYGKMKGPNPETNAAIARMLFNGSPQSNAMALEALQGMMQQRRLPPAVLPLLLRQGVLSGNPSNQGLLNAP